jgi:hypothetical protein
VYTPSRPEASLVFSGATLTEREIVALIEDTSAGKIKTVRVGDALASGKVGALTLITLAYDAGGKVTEVKIGQNLDGVAVTMPTTQAVDSSSATSSPGLSGGANEMLEKLKQKRLRELGGGAPPGGAGSPGGGGGPGGGGPNGGAPGGGGGPGGAGANGGSTTAPSAPQPPATGE